MTVHVLTGATGFVGGAIALELLDEGTNEIVGIVRETEPGQATTRLRTALIGAGKGGVARAVNEEGQFGAAAGETGRRRPRDQTDNLET